MADPSPSPMKICRRKFVPGAAGITILTIPDALTAETITRQSRSGEKKNRGEVMVASPLLFYGQFAKFGPVVFGYNRENNGFKLETFAI